MERIRLNVTDREVIINMNGKNVKSMSIDPQTQKMYWSDSNMCTNYSIMSADINGDNQRTLYRGGTWCEQALRQLYVSKDFIWWKKSNIILGIQKNQSYDTDVLPKNLTVSFWFHSIAFNYEIEENSQGTPLCKALKSMLPNYSATDTMDERYDVPVCYNYCFEGECSASTDRPQCR